VTDERYLCAATLGGITRVLVSDSEHFLFDTDGFVMTAAGGTEITYDLDAIETWCRSDDGVRDNRALLDAWNLFVDMPDGDSLFRAADARAIGLYDKLFHSCNLPSMTPPGREYVPVWLASEVAALKQVLLLGLAELRIRVR
jgi:hypothetical protein